MTLLLIWILIFVASFIVLVKSSDYFTISAEKIGLYFGLSSFVVGVFFVAIGTSLPELISSIFAVLNNSSDIVIGNVVGSNITNIFLVLGVCFFLAKKSKLNFKDFKVDFYLLIGSAFYLWITLLDSVFGKIDAIVAILIISVYIYYMIRSNRTNEIDSDLSINKKHLGITTIVIFVISAVFIYLSAEYLIKSIIKISSILNIGVYVVSLSAVALGTSLPELFVSISALKRNNIGLSVGNIVGSNIFNTFAVMSVPVFIKNLYVKQIFLDFYIPVMVLATLLFFFVVKTKKIKRSVGILFLLLYVVFLFKVFGLFI